MTGNESIRALQDALPACMPPDEQRVILGMIAAGITPTEALAALAARYPRLVERAQRMAEEMVVEMGALQ
jgi:xanthine dehydrogenase iron-sulfur cluster and FAD-binding subunit A